MANIDPEYDGFSSIRITQNLDTVSDEFSLEMLQSHGNLEIFRPFSYTPLTLELGGQKMLTGRVMATSASFSAGCIGITAQGLSLPASLIQSSISSIYYEKITFQNLVEIVAKQFGLTVIAKVETPIIPIVECQTGENAFNFLNAIAKEHNLLLQCDADGNLVINTQDPDLTSAICLSPEIASGAEITANFDSSKFSQLYIATGQVGEISVYADFQYNVVPYFCMKHIQAETDPKSKLRWQLIRDNIDACCISLSMPRWNMPDGTTFKRGQVFKIDFPQIWIDGYFRARTLTFEMSSNSKKTSIALERILQDG